jgi:sugar phosphate isomerase/epimerase
MNWSQVAAQLYTVRDHCRNAKDLAETFTKLRSIGYEAVQVSGIGSIPAAEVRQIATDTGVHLCAAHSPSDDVRKNPEAEADRLEEMGVKISAYPYPAGVDFSDPASVKAMVSDLENAARIFAQRGLSLGYHNHGVEFVRLGNETVLEYILRSTEGSPLKMELDTYWVQYGGGDPVDWCRKAAGRLPAMHLKDYGFAAEQNKPVFAEIGQGNLNFAPIIAAAEESGCQWFIVEQDVCPGNPFDSLRTSAEYLRCQLCRD